MNKRIKEMNKRIEDLDQTTVEMIQERLVSIYQKEGKITERQLLRLSAFTGIDYSTIVEIYKGISFLQESGLRAKA